MPLRFPRFRLRTVLIAMVVIGLVASRSELHIGESASGLTVRGIRYSSVSFDWPTPFGSKIWPVEPNVCYYDREDNWHEIAALFSFSTCPCCGKSWEWDGQRYVE